MKIIEMKKGWFIRVPDHFGFWEMTHYRFDPLTMIATGAVMGAAGSLMEGQAAEEEGRASQQISNYNAAVREQDAEAAKDKALFEMGRTAKEGQRKVSTLTAKLGSSGAQLGSGAPMRIIEEQRAEIELEKLLQGYEGMTIASRAESEADQYRMQGELAKTRGKNAKKASYFGAGSSLLQGFGMAFS